MSEISDRYRRNAAGFASRIDSVDPSRWNDPSPCEEWTAIQVVEHVVSSQGLFLGMVGDELDATISVEDSPSDAFAAASAQVLRRLEDEELAAQTFMGFEGETRFDAAVDRFVSLDLVVHAWDLARATGGDESMDPTEVHRILTVDVPAFGDMLHGPGVCGPVVPTDADAPEHVRLLAELGRTA